MRFRFGLRALYAIRNTQYDSLRRAETGHEHGRQRVSRQRQHRAADERGNHALVLRTPGEPPARQRESDGPDGREQVATLALEVGRVEVQQGGEDEERVDAGDPAASAELMVDG